MKIQEVVNYLNSLIPIGIQESYDNSGIQIGDAEAELKGVLISLDLTPKVVAEAMEKACNLIVTHHPFIFSGIKKITAGSPTGDLIYSLIRNGLAVYSAHTNLDKLNTGVSALLASHLGLQNAHVLVPEADSLKQLVVYCPKAEVAKLKEALYDAGAGRMGNYRHCSYTVSGCGTFEPLPGAEPFLGEVGHETATEEERVEMIYPKVFEKKIVETLKANHPYEEPAFALLPMTNANADLGLGIIGQLPDCLTAEAFLKSVKETLGLPMLRHSALCHKNVKTVAVCGGSGASFIEVALSQKADVFLTGDLKYHDFQKADGRIIVADIGHYESEQFAKEFFYDKISKKFSTFAVQVSDENTNFVSYM